MDNANRMPTQRQMSREYERQRRLAMTMPSPKDRARSSYLKNTYGITGDEYEAMLTAQGKTCAICHEACSSGRRLAVDHDHATGAVRGLLCGKCNRAVGLMSDNVSTFVRAAAYLHQHGADDPDRPAPPPKVTKKPTTKCCPKCQRWLSQRAYGEATNCKACVALLAGISAHNARRKQEVLARKRAGRW